MEPPWHRSRSKTDGAFGDRLPSPTAVRALVAARALSPETQMKPDIRHQSLVAGVGETLPPFWLLLVYSPPPPFLHETVQENKAYPLVPTQFDTKADAPRPLSARAHTR